MNIKTRKLLSVLLSLVLLLSLAGPLAPSARADGPYKVGIDDISHGSVTADKETANEGETVRLTVTPSAGYIIESISVYAIDLHSAVPVTYSEGNYVFTMPASEVQASATFRPAAPSTTEIPSVGLALTLPAAGGSYSGGVPAAVSISSGTGFTVKSANWFNGGTLETNPGCGLAPTSFEPGKPYYAEIFLAPAEGYAFTDDTAVTIDTLGVKSKAVIDDEADRMGWLYIVTEDYTIPAATGYIFKGVSFELAGLNQLTSGSDAGKWMPATPIDWTKILVSIDPGADSAIPDYTLVEAHFDFLYTDAACTTILTGDMQDTGTYYLRLVVNNKNAEDHSIDYSSLAAEHCSATVAGYTTSFVSAAATTFAGKDAVGVVFSVTRNSTPAALYTITVTGGTAHANEIGEYGDMIGAVITEAAEGDKVWLVADYEAVPEGKWAYGWTSEDVSISKGYNSFTMPAKPVTVAANYEDRVDKTYDLSSGATGSLSDGDSDSINYLLNENLVNADQDVSTWDPYTKQLKIDLDKDGSYDLTFRRDEGYTVLESNSVSDQISFTLTTPALWIKSVTFLFKAAAVPYTVDLSTGKMDLATGQEFADLFNSLGAWTHMSSTSGSSTYYYDLDKDGTEDISVTNSSSSRNVLLLTTSNITTDTYVISDSTGPYNPITFILKAPTVTTYPVWVGENQVTSANKDNIPGVTGGTASFDPSTNTLTFTTATPAITGLHENALIYADGIDLTINAASGLTLNSEAAAYGIFVNNGNLNSKASLDITVKNNTWSAVCVQGGNLDVAGDLETSGYVNVNGNVTVSGNATVDSGFQSGIIANKINIGNDAEIKGRTCGINASDDVTVGGNLKATAIQHNTWTAVFVYNGNLDVTGDLETSGFVNVKGNVTVSGNATVDSSFQFGIIAKKATVVSGRWDVTGSVYAIRTAEGIDIPATHGITTPTGGKIAQVTVDDNTFYTVTESDGTTVAKHAIIEPGAEKYPVWVGGEQVTSTNKDDILGDGKASFDPDTNTLTLNSPTVSTSYKGALIYAEGIDLNITGKAPLKNENTAYGVLVKDGSLNSDANLTVEVRQYGVSATKSININGGSVNSKTTGHGSDGVGYALGGSDIKISSGTVTATSAQGPAISTTNSVEISGGTVNVTGGFHGISTKSLAISGGTVTVEGNWNGIKAEENITISGGTVAAKSNKSSYKGIYAGGTIEIKNGTACVTADGNSGAIEGSKITIGDALMILEPTGGKLSGDGKVIQNADDTTATHAVIVPKEAATHTVTFEANGGTPVPEAQTVADGGKATKPANPTRSGFVFDGWYADATFAAAFDFGAPITADVTVYAKWTEESKPGEIVYTIVSGGNSTWTKGSSSGVTIVVKRDPNDEECFSHFASVQIGSTTLASGTDYTAVAGSTVITLNASALQKLTTGTKTVTINFDDGKAATDLTIKAGSSGTGGSTSPKTGDDSKPGLWLAVMMLSGLGIGGLVVNDKKRRYLSRH